MGERAIGGPGNPTWPSGLSFGCDGRWQLALPWADTVPFFGPQGATSAPQTLLLQIPRPPESPPSRLGCHCLLPLLPHATHTKTCCITRCFMITYSYRLMHGALSSSHSKGAGLHFVSVLESFSKQCGALVTRQRRGDSLAGLTEELHA